MPTKHSSIPTLSAYIAPGTLSDPRDAVEQGVLAERIGLNAVWLGERFDTKDFPSIHGALSQRTDHIGLGVGITPMNLRHPMVLAAAGQTLQGLTGGRFRLGLGRSVPWRWNSYGYPAPSLASMRDVALILRRLWAGETISYDGPAGRFPNLKLAQRVAQPPPPLFLAGVGPKTLALAGETFDGVILHPFLTPEAVRHSTGIVRASAEKAGRDASKIKIVATVVTAPNLTIEDAEEAILARAAGYFQQESPGNAIATANGWDVSVLTAYRNHPKLKALGEKSADKALTRKELIEIAQTLPADWFPAASASGTSAQCAEKIRHYTDAGADEILVHGATVHNLADLVRDVSLQ